MSVSGFVVDKLVARQDANETNKTRDMKNSISNKMFGLTKWKQVADTFWIKVLNSKTFALRNSYTNL